MDPHIANALAEVAAGLITAFGGWIVFYLERKLNLAKNSQAAQAFENAANNGIALASQQVAQSIAGGAVVQDKVGAITAQALQYITPKVEGEIAQLGIDPATMPQRIAARVAVQAGATPAPGPLITTMK